MRTSVEISTDEFMKGSTSLVEALTDRYQGWEGVKQFSGTTLRLVRMYQEFCWTPKKIEEELEKVFRTFEDGYNQMLVAGPINIWTLCPHHLLPCNFKVTIGYVPNGKVLGLSKFSRIADILSRRPIMQEAYSTELADMLMAKLAPKGVAVHVVGTHGCMVSRGVRQDSSVITSTIRGIFESEPETRAEFFAICRR